MIPHKRLRTLHTHQLKESKLLHVFCCFFSWGITWQQIQVFLEWCPLHRELQGSSWAIDFVASGIVELPFVWGPVTSSVHLSQSPPGFLHPLGPVAGLAQLPVAGQNSSSVTAVAAKHNPNKSSMSIWTLHKLQYKRIQQFHYEECYSFKTNTKLTLKSVGMVWFPSNSIRYCWSWSAM